MATVRITRNAMDYLIEKVGYHNVYYWKLTDKSLVWYENDNGKKGKRHVVANGEF